ncbi:MAG: hypothetical protein GY874_22220 [Desulfobacteraceae bacterium]|nr:hypothetical protein [Desulfobacteraceae bacterium]
MEDKKKCSDLYYWATKRHISPDDWNEAAANQLAILYAELSKCSAAMGFVPQPAGMKPGWRYLNMRVYDILKEKITGNGKIFESCLIVIGSKYISAIEIALME